MFPNTSWNHWNFFLKCHTCVITKVIQWGMEIKSTGVAQATYKKNLKEINLTPYIPTLPLYIVHTYFLRIIIFPLTLITSHTKFRAKIFFRELSQSPIIHFYLNHWFFFQWSCSVFQMIFPTFWSHNNKYEQKIIKTQALIYEPTKG